MTTQQILHLKAKIKQGFLGLFSQLRGGGWLAKPYIVATMMGLSLLPFFFVIVFGWLLTTRSETIERQLTKLEARARFLVKQKKERSRFLQEFGGADPEFLRNYVETERALENDIAMLKEIQKTGDYGMYKPLMRRLKFLSGEENKMLFKKGSSFQGDFYTEDHYCLERPVEMNCDDVKKVLVLLEGVKLGNYLPNPLRPQLLITSFDFTLKPQDNANKVYFLNLQLMQRGCHEQLDT